MSSAKNFTNELFRAQTADMVTVKIMAKDSYQPMPAVESGRCNHSQQEVLLSGHIQWFGKTTLDVALFLSQRMNTIDCSEIEKAIDCARKAIDQRFDQPSNAFWKFMEGNQIVRCGKAVFEYRSIA